MRISLTRAVASYSSRTTSIPPIYDCYSSFLSVRWLAFPNKWKKSKKIRKMETEDPKSKRNTPQSTAPNGTLKVAPPSFLVTTASSDVFVSQIALQSAEVDAKQLFNDADSYFSGTFRYFPPASFQHELPDAPVPEVAFLGRSNVGKSSLINALIRQKLAKSSKSPGRTQQVNYYGLVDSNDITKGYLVDLPGYGYAKGPDPAVKGWQRRTQDFLLARRDSHHLQRLFLLLDARHGAFEFDHVVMDWLDEAEIPYSLVLTKTDSTTKANVVKHANLLCMRYHRTFLETTPIMSPVIYTTSTNANKGIMELVSSIETEFEVGQD